VILQPDYRTEDLIRLLGQIGPVALGKVIGPVVVGTDSTKLAHGLRRIPFGFVEISPQNGGAVVKEAAPADEIFIYTIASSAVAAARLWVF